MPELPEVAALAASLEERTAGLRIARAELAAISALKTFDPPLAAVADAQILGWGHAGKFLICDLADLDGEPLHLIVHLARAGWVRWRDDLPAGPAPLSRGGKGPGLALRLGFAAPTGEPAGGIDITEAGTQKHLAVCVVRDPQDVPGIAALGPDPLSDDFDRSALDSLLQGAGRAQLKGIIRDQKNIAGIGNAYSDEILHVAGLSPFAPSGGLTLAARGKLLEAIKETLTAARVTALATDPTKLKAEKKANMRVHGRTGQACPICGDIVREVSFADSFLNYCPTCQTGGKILADRRMSRLLK
ncbi:MAG: DNA-formamidopyrimidine glycosylase family protein [Candidatus Nanopelagicales bacterium]